MASRHLNYLRKNQKAVMAILCVVCMITFVVGPYLLDMVGPGGGQQQTDPVVVTWNGGKIRESQLNAMRRQHILTVNFLQEIISETRRRGGTPVVFGQPVPANQPIENPGIPADAREGAVIRTMLLAKRADEMGVAVDRQAVKDHLASMSSPELQEGDWLEIAQRSIPKGEAMSVNQLFDQVGFELKAQHVRVMSQSGLIAHPPGDLWEIHNRLNRRFSIEAYPVDAAPLVSQVGGTPTEAELRKLYEEGKNRDPDPNRAEPGFHRPHQVAFEYLKIDFAPFLEEAKKKITDEQIAKQYELGKSQGKYKEVELPPVEDKPPTDKPATDKPVTDKPADDKKPEETKPEEKPADDKKPAEEKKPEEKPVEDKKPAEKPADDAKPCGQEPTEEKPAAEKTAEKPAEKPAETKPAEKPAEIKPAETTKPAEIKPAEAKPTDPKPGEEKPAETKPGETKPAEAAPETPKEPKFKPLDAVQEEIRTELAQPIAQEARDAAVKSAIREIEEFAKKHRRWLAYKDRKNKSDTVSDPGRLPIESLAAKYGFKSGSTPLVDRYTVAEYEIGQKVTQIDFQALQMGRPFQLSFADIAFGRNETLYSPTEARSSEPDTNFLYWRYDEVEAADVVFAEAREALVAAWKLQRAFELAKGEATQLAEKAKSAKSLAEVVDPAKVITTPPFSWLTTGSLGFGQPSLSQVPGISLAGREFMESVFALSPGGAGIAPNQAHTIVYVVRVLAQEPSDENLREQFLDSGHLAFVQGAPEWYIRQNESYEVAYEWFKGLEKEMGLVWARPEAASALE